MALADRFLDVGEESLQRFAPLEGYQTQEIVSIEKAIEPFQYQNKDLRRILKDAKKILKDRLQYLDIDEAAAIYLYTVRFPNAEENISYHVNKAIRTRTPPEVFRACLPYIKLLITALNKLPVKKVTVWRYSVQNLSDPYAVDFVWSGFSSCLTDVSVIEKLIKHYKTGTIFRIDCINGRDIKDYSSSPEEGEVLLMPGASFHVNKKQMPKHGLLIIEIEERQYKNVQLAPMQCFGSPMDAIYPTDSASYINLNQSNAKKAWLNLQYYSGSRDIMTPKDLERIIEDPPDNLLDNTVFNRVLGSMIGMALGDSLGAHVEFRPREYLVKHPVRDLQGGGTWGLAKGQFTDDTSMALCLACSLVSRGDFVPYDQLVRYKWWFKHGYMSSTGKCFDIGTATSQSLVQFERRQETFAKKYNIPQHDLDFLSDPELLTKFDVNCSEDGVAGNGALMRLAPVPLFFYKHPVEAVEFSGESGVITHGDRKAYDACRYYGALIVAALQGERKEALLDRQFYDKHKEWFNEKPLCKEVMEIARGSYQKKGGYEEGIRGKGYIINALEAALWAFWSDEGSFEEGALKAVNLGDDTDTTAAIYGQLAGAYYGYNELPKKWLKHVYGHDFITCLSKWIVYEGNSWRVNTQKETSPTSKNQYQDDKSSHTNAQGQARTHDASFSTGTHDQYDGFNPQSTTFPPVLSNVQSSGFQVNNQINAPTRKVPLQATKSEAPYNTGHYSSYNTPTQTHLVPHHSSPSNLIQGPTSHPRYVTPRNSGFNPANAHNGSGVRPTSSTRTSSTKDQRYVTPSASGFNSTDAYYGLGIRPTSSPRRSSTKDQSHISPREYNY